MSNPNATNYDVTNFTADQVKQIVTEVTAVEGAATVLALYGDIYGALIVAGGNTALSNQDTAEFARKAWIRTIQALMVGRGYLGLHGAAEIRQAS